MPLLNLNIDIKEFLALIRKQLYAPFGLGTLLLLVVVLFVTLSPFLSTLGLTSLWQIAAIIFLCALVSLIWYHYTRIPRTPKGHLGFVIAITAETEEEYVRLKDDFILTLKQLLTSGNLKYRFSILEFREYYSRRIQTHEDAAYYMEKAAAHFMIFGKARLRNIQGEVQHVLDLQGRVTHKPLPINISKNLSAEFTELFPLRVSFKHENDLFAFEFTSEWINLVARYIIGVASLWSGDFDYSASLFEDLREKTKELASPVPAIAKIRQRVPSRLSEAYQSQALMVYLQWRKMHDSIALAQMRIYLDRLQACDRNSYTGHLLRAILYFVTERNIQSAKAELRMCTGEQDATWKYGLAFLFAYEGHLAEAFNYYRNVFNKSVEESVPLEAEEFISWVLEQEPQKTQLYFCLGLINFKAKADLESAQNDFNKFLKHTGKNQFVEQRRKAEAYVQTIVGKRGAEETPARRKLKKKK